ncbi:MAG: hypothetical protein J2P15_20640 [Micromonosporaceae bacterium]|nr:hypothetical protein [Micromonosporaceae bacterium]
MRRRVAVLACLASTCLVLGACGANATPTAGQNGAAQYATDGTFTMAALGDIGTWDPYKSVHLYAIASLAYDSLVNQAPDGTIVSGLAATWKADANSATFTLKPGITCSDGTALTASQVASDLTYLGDATNGNSQYGKLVPPVPYTVTGDDATGTVTLTMKAPFGFILDTAGRAPIMCAKGMADRASLLTTSSGTGPFVLTNVVAGQSYTLTRRNGYTWGPGGASTSAPGTPAKVVIKVVPSETTEANLLLSGGLSFARFSGPDKQRLKAAGLPSLPLTTSTLWLWFNHLNGRVTADPLVRKALVAGLRTQELVKVATGGTGSAANGLVAATPTACPGDTVTGQLPAFDTAAAGSLLDQAGWTKGADGKRAKNGKPLTIDLHYIPALPTDRATAELISSDWAAIGVATKLTGDVDYTKTILEAGDFDVSIDAFSFTLPNQVVTYVSGPVPPKGTNFSGIDNSEYNTLVAKASALAAPAACPYWNQAEQALYKNVDLAPIANQVLPAFLAKAQATTNGFDDVIPTSIRVLK